MRDKLKSILPYLLAAIVFASISLLYCYPSFSGKVLNQGDVNQWLGGAHQLIEYNTENDIPSNWAENVFSGIPAYQIVSGNPQNALTRFVAILDSAVSNLLSLFFDGALSLLVCYFVCFFIMLRAFGLNAWISIVGSLAVSMSSYFFLIIPAGHETKAQTLALMAPVIGGFFLIFRKKRVAGAAMVMLFSSMGLMKHPQMSYYMIMMMGVFGIAEIYIHCKEKRYKDILISLAVFVVSIGVGFGTGYHSFASNNEYVKESIRGGTSELALASGEAEEETSGLDFDYATQWSYGVSETMTFLIPNYMGGASGYNVGTNSRMYKELKSHGVDAQQSKSLVSSLPTYWGEQPFTAGPVYMGAIVCFLFLLGLLIVKGPYKWALLVATLFSVALSWGHNFESLSRLFFNWFPMYSKFRAVSSILVVAEITMPLLGFLAIKDIMEGKVEKKNLQKSIGISAAVTGGICLLMAILGPSLCSFTSSYDAQTLSQMPDWFITALVDQRVDMMTSDAWRSFIFIALGALVMWVYSTGKLKFAPFVATLGVLILADMWPVDKRFFGDDNWVKPSTQTDYFKMTAVEEQILRDPDYFRVYNVTGNPFSESRTSYYLNSIGGYHAAKLRRYQDLIDAHLSRNEMSVLNMLNTRYFIIDDNGAQRVMYNPDAYGNAWFVDAVVPVENAKSESDALSSIDLKKLAVTDKKFSSFVQPAADGVAESSSIVLTAHTPDRLEYVSDSQTGGTAVFSEIYYPYGWNAYIDGEKQEHFRVDYVLRALNIPAGHHEVVFEFRPDSIYKGYKVSLTFKIIMYLVVIAAIASHIIPFFSNSKSCN